MTTTVPRLRISVLNDSGLRGDGDHVLYWMTAARRTRSNFALDRATELAEQVRRPLLILEALRSDHRWASDRTHRFVLEGMADNRRAADAAGVTYHAYVEAAHGEGKGLVAALASRACAVVTDEFPCFFLPRMAAAAAARADVRFEAVDGNGLLPLRAADREHVTAFSFRRFLQERILPHLSETPSADPLSRASRLGRASVDPAVLRRWPAAPDALLATGSSLAHLPIDHEVAPAPFRGGPEEARRSLDAFVERWLPMYVADRNQPDVTATSGLSPYLHFGHVGAHEVFRRLADRDRWVPPEKPPRANGSRDGWWAVSPAVSAFLDQVVTWRELGFNFCSRRPDGHAAFESLPAWARATLDAHRADPRTHVYTTEEFSAAATHDAIWNAAQRQLVREGRIHNYMRMLWGKKVIEWSPTPEAALETLVHLNNRFAVDGRDPNSYSGILWCFGRYDRPWGPERPVFGTVRWMSTAAAAKKLRLTDYVRRHSA